MLRYMYVCITPNYMVYNIFFRLIKCQCCYCKRSSSLFHISHLAVARPSIWTCCFNPIECSATQRFEQPRIHCLRKLFTTDVHVLPCLSETTSLVYKAALFQKNGENVPQRKKHSDKEQRVGSLQQPERPAHRAAMSHLFHGGPRQRGEHGQRLLGRAELFPPTAAV